MINHLLKKQSRKKLSHLMNQDMSILDEKNLGKPALIFSPHPDDETLGCGGTIIKKKRAGANIKIVFMADGSKSHRRFVSEKRLKSIRAREAVAAGRTLGLSDSDIHFLGYKDAELFKYRKSAVSKVIEILLQQQPEEIFIPYYQEPSLWNKDHLATNRIVLSAIQRLRKNIDIFEYPIWFLCYWPWANTPIYSINNFLYILKINIISNYFLLKDFHCSVYIGDVLGIKRAALNQHKSQMTRLVPNPLWRILSDVSNGEFLEIFFQEYEIFHRYNSLDMVARALTKRVYGKTRTNNE
jgi:LmbE family N-acetylglucosaminyl deacetylase